jgi:hypothetical protein
MELRVTAKEAQKEMTDHLLTDLPACLPACLRTAASFYPCPEVSSRNIVDMNTLTAERGAHKYTSSLRLI